MCSAGVNPEILKGRGGGTGKNDDFLESNKLVLIDVVKSELIPIKIKFLGVAE